MNKEVVTYTRDVFFFPCSFPEEARVLLLSGEGQKDSPALRGGRPQRASQMAEERPGDQAFSQVRDQTYKDARYTSTRCPVFVPLGLFHWFNIP